MKLAVTNIYFQTKEEQRVTYKSRGRYTQVDYIQVKTRNLKEIRDCKVILGESVARQHRVVIAKMVLQVHKKSSVRTELKVK